MNRKSIIILITITFLYLFLILQANNIQTKSTFPVWWNNIDNINFFENNREIEIINIDDWKWNNINWLYLWTWKWKTVYYFHGNWWPLSMFYNEIEYINSLGYNVLAYDFPWYGFSTWTAHKNIIDNFSQVFYDFVKKEKNINDDELIIWWYSAWTAVSIDFASKNIFEKLVLVSPLASRYDMWESIFWFALNKYLFLPNSYISKELVKEFDKPVLFIHWNNDRIVPFSQWKEVFENYANSIDVTIEPNKYFIEIDNFWHNWIIDTFWDVLKYKIWDFLKNSEIKFNDEYIFLDEEWIQENEEKKEEIRAKIERKRKMYLFLDKLKIKKLEQENKIINLWLEEDSSITKFLNNKVAFNNLWYIPSDLVSIKWEFIVDVKWNQVVRKEAKNALLSMAKDFYWDLKSNIVVVSAYRSYLYQEWIKDRWCPDNLCSKAGYSEHQSWLAIDLWETTTNDEFLSKPILKEYFDWMNNNAHKYWYHNTYQKWVEIDWYEIEPWHWRYLWIELATYLKENDLTFSEYYNIKK